MKSFVQYFSFSCLLSITTFGVSANTQDAEALFDTINQRLSYMKDVGLYKAQNQLAIENVERERVVLNSAKTAAAEKGLDADAVAGFFTAQISAAKAIQYRYRADLLSQPSQRQPLDLTAEIRPALLTLGHSISAQMAAYIAKNGRFKPSQRSRFLRIVDQQYLFKADKQRLFDGLLKIK